MRTGLVLGKFAPLHKGHQHLIDYALARVDHLVALIYACEDVIGVPLGMRANWIRALYPSVEVIEAPDGPQEIGATAEIMAKQEAYILARLQGRKISHFFSSEFYGGHVSLALGAEDCRVDPARAAVPIAAAQIRKNYYRHRHWLHPRVYRDLIKKIVFLGAPSTGKTTLAKTLAQRYQTQWMPEYGRTYWEAHQQNRRLKPEQLVCIAETHVTQEEAMLGDCQDFLFVDTNAISTYHFSNYYHGYAMPKLVALATEARQCYQFTFLCCDDIPYEETWDRSGVVHRSQFQEQIKRDLLYWKVPYVELRGDLEQRVQQVMACLSCDTYNGELS